MCTTLEEVREALAVWAEGFDPATVSSADAARVVTSATAIESIAATLTCLAAARAADGGGWRREGHRSSAEALARQTGTSIGAARAAIETGRRLPAQDDVVQAALRGELSAAQVALIASAAEVDPGAGPRLVAQAPEVSLCELRDEVARTRAAALVDPDARRQSIHARRRLRAWTDPEGVWHLTAEGNPEDGARIMAAVRSRADARFVAARRAGRHEAPEAYAFDGLVDCACDAVDADRGGSTGGARTRRGTPVKLLLRVDYDTWLRGVPVDGETCELVGYGPIAVSAVRDLLAHGDAFVTAVLTKAQAVVGIAHLGRQPTAAQQTALEWLYPSCAVEGCPSHASLERDHRVDWARTHYTMLDLLDRLCHHHHRLKTTAGWELVEGRGKRPFVAPDDPRHPKWFRRAAVPSDSRPPP